MLIKKKKGQSTVEYIILVTAVIGVVIAFLMSPASPFRTKLNETLNSSVDTMATMAGRIDGTFNSSNQP